MDTSQIAITTSEISLDPVTALEIGTSWGIHAYELKTILKTRVPRVPPEDLARLDTAAKEHDAHFVAVSPGLWIGSEWGSEAARVQSTEILPETLAFAQRYGADKVVVFAGRRPPGTPAEALCPPEGIGQLYEAAEAAKREGLTLVLESLPGSWADTAAHTADVLRRVDHSAFMLNWDPGNVFAAGDRAPSPDGYRLVAPWVRHVHIKDARPDDSSFGTRWLPIGEGQIDWAGQLRALADAAYGGALVIETHRVPLVRSSYTNCERLAKLIRETQKHRQNTR